MSKSTLALWCIFIGGIMGIFTHSYTSRNTSTVRTDEPSRTTAPRTAGRDVTYKIVVTDVVQAYIDGREVTVKELQREMNVDELPRIAEDGIAGTDTVNRILNLNGWEVK